MKYERLKIAPSAIALLAVLLPAQAHAVPVVSYDLNFETTGQSLWGPGSALQLNETKFLGLEWNNQTVSLDAIAGDATTQIPNPLRLGYDTAFAACTLLYSANICINGQTAQVGVPALGSRPTVRSCGTFDFGCQAARLGDIARRTAYDAAFATCRVGFSATVCRNGQPLKLPVAALGTAPPSYLNVDTRTGVAVNGHVDGRAGLELGVKADSGSVNAQLAYQATFEIPDTAGLDKAVAISFNTNSLLKSTSSLDTIFSNVVLTADAVLQVSGSVGAEGCFITQGCITGGAPFSIDEKAPVLSFNADGNGGVLLLGQPPSFFGLNNNANAFPFTYDVLGGVAEVTLHLPQPNATGGLDSTGARLTATGQDDLVDLLLDVDNIVAIAAGVPGLFGQGVDIPLLGSLSYDIINLQIGPTVDLQQDFELDPTLYVSLAFDKSVKVGSDIVTSLTVPWDLLPAIEFLDDVTTVIPTFFVEADLRNSTLLDFDLNIGVDLLQIEYDVPLLSKSGKIGVGNVLDKGVDLFDSPDLYSNLFALEGFNLQIGDPFVIDFTTGSKGPATSAATFAINEIVLPGDVTVAIPVPGSLALLIAGLLGLGVCRRQR